MNETYINKELCKPIPGYSRYVVSATGRFYRVTPVKKHEFLAQRKNPDKLYFHESKVHVSNATRRYPDVRVGMRRDDGLWRCAGAASLVAQAFGIYPPKNTKGYYKVGFKDGDFKNISVDNLHYVQRVPTNYILVREDVVRIKKLIKKGVPLRHIADAYGVCEMQINRIKTGENWNGGRRVIEPPKLLIKVEDGLMRKLLYSFECVKSDKEKMPFDIIRTKGDQHKNTVLGIVDGYKFVKNHKNISRARAQVYTLNKYFFTQEMAEKMNSRIESKLSAKNLKNVTDLYRNKRRAN